MCYVFGYWGVRMCVYTYVYMGVNPKIGVVKPPKMDGVYFMENPMNKWMIWGYQYFWKHPYIYI